MLLYTYMEHKKLDKKGKEVILQCPLIGLKAFEFNLESINKSLYNPADGRTDPRLHDACQYGPALL